MTSDSAGDSGLDSALCVLWSVGPVIQSVITLSLRGEKRSSKGSLLF